MKNIQNIANKYSPQIIALENAMVELKKKMLKEVCQHKILGFTLKLREQKDTKKSGQYVRIYVQAYKSHKGEKHLINLGNNPFSFHDKLLKYLEDKPKISKK